MSKICLFYATGDDLLTVTEKVESAAAIKYVRFGTVTELPPERFDNAAQIPNLGIAVHQAAGMCDTFLVCDASAAIIPREVKTLTEEDINRLTTSIGDQEVQVDKNNWRRLVGVRRFAIDQLKNPDTITFSPGGLWNNDILLHGRVATASQSKSSQALMKRFKAALQKTFVKVKAFYVGPQALMLLKNGQRLTVSAQSPREFDLAIESSL